MKYKTYTDPKFETELKTLKDMRTDEDDGNVGMIAKEKKLLKKNLRKSGRRLSNDK